MTTERIEELLALAALGELSPAEVAELDELAAADVELRDELDAALAVAADIQAATPLEPPERLRDAVLAAVADTAQEPGDVAQDPGDGEPRHDVSTGGDEVVIERSAANVVPLHRRRSLVLLAAAALVFLIGGAVVVDLVRDSQPDVVAEVVDADDATFRGLDGDLGTSVEVVFSASSDAVVVRADGVDAVGDAQTYVLWLIDDSGATAAGTFRPDSDGVVRTRLDGVDPTGRTLGITVESVDDIDTPTPPVLATG